MFGIEAIQLYIPKTYVDQTQLEQYYAVGSGKYTRGLGQSALSFAFPFQDVNSLALTVVRNLLKNNKISPDMVGRLEIGTETLLDKSKSTKTLLMTLFPNNPDIEGATSLNACYGGTNALLNTLNWVSSTAWDGRYGIVVAADVAVYQEGPARPTGGAGAVAMLIGSNPKILISPIRASFMAHHYDFYKPLPSSEYPMVDGKLSMECYLKALEQCYSLLQRKINGRNILKQSDFLCFHTPFAKMISKAFLRLSLLQDPSCNPKAVQEAFKEKVEPSLYISKRVGNIYCGSLFAGLVSLLLTMGGSDVHQQINSANTNGSTTANTPPKSVLLFSYGSGLCSTMMRATIISNPLSPKQVNSICSSLNNRVKIAPKKYSEVMLQKEQNYNRFQGEIPLIEGLLNDEVFYLQRIDEKYRRHYQLHRKQIIQNSAQNEGQNTAYASTNASINAPTTPTNTNSIPSTAKKSSISALTRIETLDRHISIGKRHFHKLTVPERRVVVLGDAGTEINGIDQINDSGMISGFDQINDSEMGNGMGKNDPLRHLTPNNSLNPSQLLESGGLNSEMANAMIQNVIGKLSLPIGVIPLLTINRKSYVVPLAIEQPSVVAACSAAAKLISPYSFFASSTPNIMIGQIHLPSSEIDEIHRILSIKVELIRELNECCPSMVARGGGVKDIRVRELKNGKQYAVDILINVCEAMGANITNTIAERAKELMAKRGIRTGIAILSNYCTERRTVSWFQIPLQAMNWKGVAGREVAEKMLQAYEFARADRYRAATHNKGIMNGVDAVCLATGQDWRAVESAVHCYASRTGEYLPLTHYELAIKDGKTIFRGRLEIPLAVGTKGGSLQKNPLYKLCHSILGNPSARQLSEVIVSVGLAQNFAALRALAVEGIQKGHMVLHARAIATKMQVGSELIEECCKYMALRQKYDAATVEDFLKGKMPKL